MKEFKQYRRIDQPAEMRPYEPGEDLISKDISVSEVDRRAGSPREGDMIARNPDNHRDQWLVSKRYFETYFQTEPIDSPPQKQQEKDPSNDDHD